MSLKTLHQAIAATVKRFLPNDFFIYQLTAITDSSAYDDTVRLDNRPDNRLVPPKIYAYIAQITDAVEVGFFVEKTAYTQDIFDKQTKNVLMQRADYLWQSECFECFLAQKYSSHYIETNLAINGCYNIYRFDGYRTPNQMPPLADTQHTLSIRHIAVLDDGYVLTFHIRHHNQALKLGECQFNLTAILYPIIHKASVAVYYAIKHTNPPNFHERSCWL